MFMLERYTMYEGVELSAVMAKAGDSPAAILKYYTKLSEIVMRRFMRNESIIPNERL